MKENIDFYETAAGKKALEKIKKRFDIAYTAAESELRKIVKSGRKDVACRVLMDAMNGLIKIGKKGYPVLYGAGFRSDKGVKQEEKMLLRRLKKAEVFIEDMHNALSDMYACKLVEEMRDYSLWAAEQFLYDLMGLV